MESDEESCLPQAIFVDSILVFTRHIVIITSHAGDSRHDSYFLITLCDSAKIGPLRVYEGTGTYVVIQKFYNSCY